MLVVWSYIKRDALNVENRNSALTEGVLYIYDSPSWRNFLYFEVHKIEFELH